MTKPKELICYQINEQAPPLVPARSERAWMDETVSRYAYRCLPLSIANAMGWELLCPDPFEAEWNGGDELDDIEITSPTGAEVDWFAQSHFGHGVLTFSTHYLFRTEPGIALWARGAPNHPKDGIAPLDGIIETDWLNFSFTMNWKFTRPGRVGFDKDEPFCFITPIAYHALDDLAPEIVPIAEAPEVAEAFENFVELRQNFNDGLAKGDAETVKAGWQKWYMRGVQPTGEIGNPDHISKLRLASPKRRQPATDPPLSKPSNSND